MHRRGWGCAGLLEPARADRRAVHPGPFSTTPGATLYRTGDRARWRSDGTLEHLGRLDDQVKMRGFRIELGEIERVLAHDGRVEDAVAIIRKDDGDEQLVAYYIPGAATPQKISDLREVLRDKLPDYMIPSRLVAVGALPRTPNGKVDRRALPETRHCHA